MKNRYIFITFSLIYLLMSCVPASSSDYSQDATQNAPQPVTPTTAVPSPTLAADSVGKYSRVEIAAPSLSNNLIGEPDKRTINIYLPPSYDSSNQRYPVVYYLPGYNASGMEGINFPEDIDQLIRSGAIREMIIVVASGLNKLNGSFYVNSPVTGNWEDFIAVDVVNYVDANYRTIPEPGARGISGHSMGGFGALNIAMHRPDIFHAVYSLSPGLFDENGLTESQIFFTENQKRAFIDYRNRIRALPEDEAKRSMLVSPPDKFVLGYGLAFAPNPKRPPYFDYPFPEVNGQIVRDEAIWKKWEGGLGNTAEKIQEYQTNLASLKGIVLDVGTADEFQWIPKGCDYFDAQLTTAGISHTYYKHAGSHQDHLAERIRDYMLPFFSNILST